MQNCQTHGRWFSGEKDLDGCRGGHMAQKCHYSTIAFILLKEVSASRFGRSQHKGQTILRAVCLTIVTVP